MGAIISHRRLITLSNLNATKGINMQTIDIIGGGIAGLTLAVALKQKGFRVRVFEQAPALRVVGAGINLACNAMQVYDYLGLRPKLEAVGHICQAMEVSDAQLRPLSTIDIRPFARRYGVQNVAIHRAALQSVLRAELNEEEVLLGKELQEIHQNGELLNLTFTDGTSYESNCLIGADGIHSVVRQQVLREGAPQPAGQMCWRGVTDFELPSPYDQQLTEAWGREGRFGFVKINAHQVYWFAVIADELIQAPVDKSQLLDVYQHFNPLVGQLLAATAKEAIHEAPLSDLKAPKCWYQERVCLIGDAAHATTPNLGQGACQAIEDAWVLAHCLEDSRALTPAFNRFQSIRERKVKQVVNTSRQVGQMAHWRNPLAVGLRNTLMRTMPKRLGERQSEQIYTLEVLQ